jgi:hypothetical protein
MGSTPGRRTRFWMGSRSTTATEIDTAASHLGFRTLRFALAIRPRPGFRLGLAAATAAVVGAGLVLLRDRLTGLVDPEVFVGLLAPLVAAWGAVSGILLLAQGLQLRRVARGWRGADGQPRNRP